MKDRSTTLSLLILLILFVLESCKESLQRKSNVATKPSNITGRNIVNQNCSGCHSMKDDTLFSHVKLYDLYSMDSNVLHTKISKIINDSNHRSKTTIKDSTDITNTVIYIKHFFDPKY